MWRRPSARVCVAHPLAHWLDGLAQLTLKVIKDHEVILAEKRVSASSLREDAQLARLQLREREAEARTAAAEAGDADALAAVAATRGVLCNIRELDDVLVRDVGNRIAQDGRWPLLVDASNRVSTFLRYRDTNYLNVCSPRDMSAEAMRMALLGAIRYGKPLVADLMDIDCWDVFAKRLDGVEDGLCAALMSKELLANDRFKSLIRKTDGDAYRLENFQPLRWALPACGRPSTLTHPLGAQHGQLSPDCDYVVSIPRGEASRSLLCHPHHCSGRMTAAPAMVQAA